MKQNPISYYNKKLFNNAKQNYYRKFIHDEDFDHDYKKNYYEFNLVILLINSVITVLDKYINYKKIIIMKTSIEKKYLRHKLNIKIHIVIIFKSVTFKDDRC